VTGGQAHLAIDLISFDQRFEPVMQFVFGNTFVSEDESAAKKIAHS